MFFTAAVVVLVGVAHVARRLAGARSRPGTVPLRVVSRDAYVKRRR